MFANMHNHSTFSDGVYTPSQIVNMAKALGYQAIVLTDHDTVQGTYFLQKAARKQGLLSVLGCEFSTDEFGQGFHLLGFDFNSDSPEIRKILYNGAQKERRRTQLLLRWAQEKGRCRDVTWQEVCEAYPYNDYLCNNHIFNVLVRKGALRQEDYFDYFDTDFRWNPEREAAVRAELRIPTPSTAQVIRAIRAAEGVPVLAHPTRQLAYIPELIQVGLMGVEANHPDLSDEESAALRQIAAEQNLYQTGGTDHSGKLGGYEENNPQMQCSLTRNCADRQSFLQLYHRELG